MATEEPQTEGKRLFQKLEGGSGTVMGGATRHMATKESQGEGERGEEIVQKQGFGDGNTRRGETRHTATEESQGAGERGKHCETGGVGWEEKGRGTRQMATEKPQQRGLKWEGSLQEQED